MIEAKMEADGQVVLPQEICEKLGLKAGDTVLWEFVDSEARLTTPSALIRQLPASIRQTVAAGPSLAGDLIAERRVEADRK